MKSLPKPHFERARSVKQRGVVLFLTLVALLAMSLAAVALIRSVDTSTLIAGNMAFKHSTATSADGGIESAITALNQIQAANAAKSVMSDVTHAFNMTDATTGYYSNANNALDLFSDATWDAITNTAEVIDSSGNRVRYIVQRMCRTAGAVPSTQELPAATPPRTACLFSNDVPLNGQQNVPLPSDICEGSGCTTNGQTPQYRITARATGPRFAVSYVQAFIY